MGRCGDPAILSYPQDLAGLWEGAETVGNEKDDGIPAQGMDAVKELVFRFPVYRREGVIQNNEGAAVVEKAGYHDPGLLAAGKAEPSFADYCFYTLGKGGGFFVKAGAPQRFFQISFFSKPYILFQGGIEELHGMAHIAYERQGGICPGPVPFFPR